MAWPAPDEYSEAVQNPATTLSDPELQKGSAVCNALGLPVVSSGAFASVYRFQTATKSIAVRCFLRELKDRKVRYRRISEFVQGDSLESTVDFQFIERGVLIGGNWYPILKMEWVDGLLLNQYVEQNLHHPEKIGNLAEKFKDMVLALLAAGAAHGDLQHGNILVCNDELRLVDYDGMFVPSLNGEISQELGHPNYQHPLRTPEHFGTYMDNFSSWIIYITLRCLYVDPTLWKTDSGDERLLLGRHDFKAPDKSAGIAQLLAHRDSHISSFGEIVLELLKTPPNQIPSLSEALQGGDTPAFNRLLKRFGLRAKAAWQLLANTNRRTSQSSITSETPGKGFPSAEQSSSSSSESKWYEDWLDTGKKIATSLTNRPSRDLTDVQQPITGNPPKTQSPGSQSLISSGGSKANQKAAPGGSNVPGHGARTRQIEPMPNLEKWEKLPLEEKRRIAYSFTAFTLAEILKNINHVFFEVAVKMLAYKCTQSTSDASIGCVTLAGLIVELTPVNYDMLPLLQSSLELALSSAPQGNPPPWITRSYFRALEALMIHKADDAPADLYSFLRTWCHLPNTTTAELEDHLFILLEQKGRSDELVVQTMKTLLLLIELYMDRRTAPYEIDKLGCRLGIHFATMVSEKKHSVFVRSLAQKSLKSLAKFGPPP